MADLDLLIHTTDTTMLGESRSKWTDREIANDRAACMKQGYIQAIQPVGYQWGLLENDPKRFIHLIIPENQFDPKWLDRLLDADKEDLQDSLYKFDITKILTEGEYEALRSIPYNETTLRSTIVKGVSSTTGLIELVDWQKETLREPLKLHGSAGDFTVRPSGSAPAGDYTSLKTAVETEAANISGGSTDARFFIQHNGTDWGVDTGNWDVDGWTMGTNEMLIQTQGNARHSGASYSTTAHRIENTTEWFDIEIPNVTVDGIQGKFGSGSTAKGLRTSGAATATVFKNSLLLSDTVEGDGNGIICDVGTHLCFNLSIQKPIDTGSASEGIIVNAASGATKIYNCTINGFNDGVEFEGGSGHEVKNCAIFNNGNDIDDASTGIVVDFCATDDGDGTNAVDISPGGTEATDWNAAVTDYTTGDHSVKDTSSVLYNAGTDLTSSGVTDDIIGTSRPQSTSYDIGAFELIVAAPGGDPEQGIRWFSQLLNPTDFLVAGAVGLVAANPKMTKREFMNPFKYFIK